MWKKFLDFLARLLGPKIPVPEPGPPPNPGADDVYQRLLAAHNAERAKVGQPPLKLNARLQTAAQNHSNWMHTHSKMSHDEGGVGPGERMTDAGYRWRSMGENIASGFPTVAGVMNAWMSSPGHQHNILGNYQDVGFGFRSNYWTADFGVPAAGTSEREVRMVSSFWCEVP